MSTPSIFDRLRSMQTEGLPLHTLIVEACEVGNDLLAALEWAWHPVAAANDDDGPRRDPALGGLRGLFIMYAVAVLIGVLLATGGVL